jgi:hypothetical protein
MAHQPSPLGKMRQLGPIPTATEMLFFKDHLITNPRLRCFQSRGRQGGEIGFRKERRLSLRGKKPLSFLVQ